MTPASTPSRPAFTLVELLVVIAIIVSLLAILLPSLSQAVGVSQSAKCASNLHQVFLAAVARAADHPTPEIFWRFDNGSADYPWESGHGKQPGTPARALYEADGQKQRYIDDARVFFCPTVPMDFDVYFNPSPTGDFQTFHGTYAWHWRVVKVVDDPYAGINGSALTGAGHEARDLIMIDQRFSTTAYPFVMGYSHFNGIMRQGDVQLITREASDLTSYLWGDAGKPY